MAKDPAFLFFPNDWLGGTMTLTREQKGAYVDLLMAQFNSGHMMLQEIKTVLGEKDFQSMWDSVLSKKFVKDNQGKYYNKRLEDEVIKRRNYSESRRKNRINGNTYDK